MPLSTTKLIASWRRIRQLEGKPPKNMHQAARPASYFVRELVIESLARTEQDVYRHLADRGETSAAEVAAEFSLSLRHALNVLNHLYQYGLLKRRRNPANNFFEYLWSLEESEAAR